MQDALKMIKSIKLLNDKKRFFDQQLRCYIQNILDEIKGSEDREFIEVRLNLLGVIQMGIAVLLFKENIELSDVLKKFTSYFDRIDDDIEMRKYLLKKIINGEVDVIYKK